MYFKGRTFSYESISTKNIDKQMKHIMQNTDSISEYDPSVNSSLSENRSSSDLDSDKRRKNKSKHKKNQANEKCITENKCSQIQQQCNLESLQ